MLSDESDESLHLVYYSFCCSDARTRMPHDGQAIQLLNWTLVQPIQQFRAVEMKLQENALLNQHSSIDLLFFKKLKMISTFPNMVHRLIFHLVAPCSHPTEEEAAYRRSGTIFFNRTDCCGICWILMRRPCCFANSRAWMRRC